ncbi:hypothetical protein SLEP1_g19612 [Rubroshorea leprosula]|uniref:F-box domain-containing protein n=1 Tax=Rubroshorea leprosula TaxID=152421 RepID=A0AAV5J5H4_9ROSI|nr:hypothetical protein SLEP1_g19612 [Rubroshorea leprosula]
MEKKAVEDCDGCHQQPRMPISSVSGTRLKSGNKNTSKQRYNKRNARKECTWRPWSDLPGELLSEIAKGLSVADYLSFGRVCRNWRSITVSSKREFLESQAPLVLVISSHARKTCFFFDMSSQDTYRTVLPKFSGRSIVGISSGYLIMQLSDIMLTNPITGHTLEFPGALQPFPDRITMSDGCIFASTMPHQDFLVVALFSMHLNLQFRRSRDHQWTFYSYAGEPWEIKDITAFGARIYALTSDSQIRVLSLKNPPTMEPLQLKGKPHLGSNVTFAASDEHLVVLDLVPHRRVEVYRIDFVSSQWVKVDDLGDQSVFMSDMIHLRLASLHTTASWGGRRNCVYYLGPWSAKGTVFTLEGDLVENISVAPGDRLRSIRASYGWYFPRDSHKMNSVWDDQFDDDLTNA